MMRSDLLTLLRERIVSFAASRMRGGGSAWTSPEDVAQETLLLLEEKYPHVQRIEELLPLSMRIVRYKMLGVLAKTRRRGAQSAVPVEDAALADPLESPEAALLRRERSELLHLALAGLGDRCREIFRLRMEGLGFPEMATKLGANSINTMYTWDSRCRRELIERLNREDLRRAR